MPERGERWGAAATSAQADGGAVVGAAVDAPVWTPYPRPAVTVVVPAELTGSGQPVRELPCVGVFGPDLVFGDYAYIEALRVVSASGAVDLDLDLDPGPLLQTTGGTLLRTFVVLRVVGEQRETYAGDAYDVEPCFSLALEVGPDGSTTPVHTEAIAYLVHDPAQRPGRVEVDFERVAAVAAAAAASEPVVAQPEVAVPVAVPAPAPAAAPAPVVPAPVAVLVDPGPMPVHVAPSRPVSAGAVDVLPASAKPAGRRGLFGRKG